VKNSHPVVLRYYFVANLCVDHADDLGLVLFVIPVQQSAATAVLMYSYQHMHQMIARFDTEILLAVLPFVAAY